MGRFVQPTPALEAYLSETGARETPAQTRCREETAALPLAIMQISPEQGAFLQVLARLANARACIEVGVFTGYSALSLALALPPTAGSWRSTSARNSPTAPEAIGRRAASMRRSTCAWVRRSTRWTG